MRSLYLGDTSAFTKTEASDRPASGRSRLPLWVGGQPKRQSVAEFSAGDNAEARSVLLWSALELGFTG